MLEANNICVHEGADLCSKLALEKQQSELEHKLKTDKIISANWKCKVVNPQKWCQIIRLIENSQQ